MISLTICIFTYNRDNFLRQCLESIRRNVYELQPGTATVDIVVSDNASVDQTTSVVNEFKAFLPITYNRNEANVGVDNNIRIAAGLARGEYIWLMADDDALIDGALKYLVDFLRNNPEVVYVFYPRLLTNKNLEVLTNDPQPAGVAGDLLFKSGRDLLCAFDGQMAGVILYVSSTVIKRSVWEESARLFPPDIKGWGHAKPLFHAILERQSAILGKAGLLTRLDNYRDASSFTWLDNYISVWLFAMQIGYSKGLCEALIRHLAKDFSPTFVLDKARGLRRDSIPERLSELGCANLYDPNSFWVFMSRLPVQLLKILLPLYCLRKWIRRLVSK
jgi:glycosyltransferase involved in cell wall biosynthesis